MTAWDFKGKRQNLICHAFTFFLKEHKYIKEDLHYPRHIPPVSGQRPGAPVPGETKVQGGRGEQDPAEPDQVRVEGQGLRDGQQGRLKKVLLLHLTPDWVVL